MTSLTDEWRDRFMQMAEEAAKNSTCLRRKVGAVLITNYLGLPVRTGWNVENPRTLRCDQGDCPRGQKSYEAKPEFTEYSDCVAIHAEMWVIQGYEEEGRHFTVFVTCQPCPYCQEVLDQHGFTVVYPGKES